ncbi:MAG: hypothetical protein ACYCO5_15820 [Acidobacteriaceae bacterium]
MRKTFHPGTLIAFMALISFWTPLLRGQGAVVTVRLVNGKSGKPVTDENLNVWIDNSTDSQLFRPDRDGVIKLSVPSNGALSFASNIQVTCHPYSKDEHLLRKYQVSEILEHGIADQNLCSTKIHAKAHPGEFVFFERPRTFWEWMRL